MSAIKKIYDPIHGFIRFNSFEKDLIDSMPFRRLQGIHQLGIAFLIYPGATHTRFEHSLGTMELASKIFDQIHTKSPIPDGPYWRQIVRCAALCHDLGHLPFSHAAERELLGPLGHEQWTYALIMSPYLMDFWHILGIQFGISSSCVAKDVAKISLGEGRLLSLGKKELFTPWDTLLSQIICADFFGADRIDYLLRDAQCTGVSYGLFDYHQLIDTLTCLPDLRLGLEEDGVESCEALFLARFFMHKRVYQYSSVKACTFHLARFMRHHMGLMEHVELGAYLSWQDSDLLSALRRGVEKPFAPGHLDALCLMHTKERFMACKLPPHVQPQMLIEFQEKEHIPLECLSWDIRSEKKKRWIRLTCPVWKRNGQIVEAADVSELSIPLESSSWLYISPHYRLQLDRMRAQWG